MAGQPQIGLPEGAINPNSNVSQVTTIPYGQGEYRPEADRQNPMNNTKVTTIINNARKRFNETIREAYPTDFEHRLIPNNEQPPMLVILMEVLSDATCPEPLRTEVLGYLQDQQVEISVYVPSGHVDPTTGEDMGYNRVTTKWRKAPYHFYSWKTSTVPMHVAIMLLNQLDTYRLSMDTREVVMPGGITKREQRKLRDDEFAVVGFTPYREPTAAELSGDTNHGARGAIVARVNAGGSGGGALRLNIKSPRDQKPTAVAFAEHAGPAAPAPTGTGSTSIAPPEGGQITPPGITPPQA